MQPLEDTLVAGFRCLHPVIDAILPLSANAMLDNIIVSGREFGAVASHAHAEVLIGSVAEDDNVTCADAALAFRIYGDDFIAEAALLYRICKSRSPRPASDCRRSACNMGRILRLCVFLPPRLLMKYR
jgi:hypothetical protein